MPIAIAVDSVRPRQRAFGGDGVEGVQQRVHGIDARERLAADLRRGSLAGPYRVADLADRHPMTRGTLKSPASSAGSGALASAVSRSRLGCSSSGRSTACRVTMLAVGATPVVSICWTCSA